MDNNNISGTSSTNSTASRRSASSMNSYSRRNRSIVRGQEQDRLNIIGQNVARLRAVASLNQHDRDQLVQELNIINIYQVQRNNSASSLSSGSNLQVIHEDFSLGEDDSSMSVSEINTTDAVSCHTNEATSNNSSEIRGVTTPRDARRQIIARNIPSGVSLTDVFDTDRSHNNQNNIDNNSQHRGNSNN